MSDRREARYRLEQCEVAWRDDGKGETKRERRGAGKKSQFTTPQTREYTDTTDKTAMSSSIER